MSGIAGIIHFDGRPVEPGQIEAMTQLMAFRGPDGINHWRSGHVALGHCMLRTTPESLEEIQPLTNEDQSLVLVMDGRVDNWEELRRELLGKGVVLRTRADAELVLRAYEVWGDASPQHIDGDFAYVIWDARRRQAFCVRDRFGNKPFHYHWNGKTLAFSTDLRPTLELPWVPKALDLETVAEYLANDWQTIDTTVWQGIKRLLPAHAMYFNGERGEPRLASYWVPDFFASLPCKTDEEYAEHYRAVFMDAVRRTSRSHKPLAFEVSGGLDSSAIFAVAATLKKNGRLPAPNLRAYTLDFSGDKKADELSYALAVGAHLGHEIHRIRPGHKSIRWYQEMAIQARDFADYPNGATNLPLSQRASEAGSCVLISGTGGDEWAGGHFVYRAEALAQGRWRDVRDFFVADTHKHGLRTALRVLARRGLLPLLSDEQRRWLRNGLVRLGLRTSTPMPKWLTSEMQGRLMGVRERQRKGSPAVQRLGQRHQLEYLYAPFWQSAKGINDRRSGRCKLEWRQPFWSTQMVELAFATPDYMLSRHGVNRWLHRQALRPLLPEMVINRTDKAEFSTSFVALWPELRQELQAGVLARNSPWVNAPEILSMMDSAFTDRGKGADYRTPWVLLIMDALRRGERE